MKRKVVICGVDTASLPRLTGEQSRQLLLSIKAGNKQDRNYFIMCNMRLVLSVVQRYAGKGNIEDLFQIGCVGLIKSVDNFNTDLNVRFSTYAVPMIIGEIRRFLRESNSMRVSRGIRDVAYKALRTREQMERETGNEVTLEEVAEQLSLPVYKVVYCLDAISDTVSLSDNVYNSDEDSATLQDQLFDNRISENVWAENVTLQQALDSLNERERDIVMRRYFQDKTQVEVSGEIGLSQAQVSRLEKNAVTHLRQSMS